MMRHWIMTLYAACLLLLITPPVNADDAMHCTECGMVVDLGSRYAATIEGEQKTVAPFCDIGDLLVHLNKTSSPTSLARVRDHTSGEWIPADKAFYVHNEKAFRTPMRWGIAAFRDRESAARYGEPRDLTQIREAVR